MTSFLCPAGEFARRARHRSPLESGEFSEAAPRLALEAGAAEFAEAADEVFLAFEGALHPGHVGHRLRRADLPRANLQLVFEA